MFEFQNNGIKKIISSIHESIKYYYPHIYSSQMFYIIDFNKTCLFKLKNNYNLITKYIYGTFDSNGVMDVSVLNYTKIYLSRNYYN